MRKEPTDEAIKATDNMLTDLWLNALLLSYNYYGKYVFDMTSETEGLRWKEYVSNLKTGQRK